MRWLRALFVRFGGLFGKDPREREFAAELESHLLAAHRRQLARWHVAGTCTAGGNDEAWRR